MFSILCLFVLILTMPSELTVETKVISISIAVSAIMLVLKQAPVLQKWIQGWVAIAVNVVLSVVGVYAVVQPSQVFTLQTFLTVLTAALAAAGVHGTTTKMMARSRAIKDAKFNAEVHARTEAAKQSVWPTGDPSQK
jgi:hypothetical protein